MRTASSSVSINKQYKDKLFCMLFGDERYKQNILDLYNALNGTNYTDPNDVSITTIDEAIYIKMKNDVSILIDDYMSLWEQQSTFNPNMPVRGLMYFGELYHSYIKCNGYSPYSRTLIKLPTPKYVVLYNGAEERPEREILRLSDSFIHTDSTGDFEWTATMINLNKGKNDGLLSKCKALSDYMTLINQIRIYKKEMKGKSLESVIDAAVEDCIKKGVLKEFLTKHRAEVKAVCIKDFDQKAYDEDLREEGEKNKGIKIALKMLQRGDSKEDIMDLGITEEEYSEALVIFKQ